MKNHKRQRTEVCLPARMGAWIAALLLVPLLTGALYGWTALRLTTDQGLHERIALKASVISDQMAQVEQKAAELAEEYSFDAALVSENLNSETLMDLNRQVITWWTDMSTTGVPEEMPLWDGQALRDALLADEAFQETHGILARDVSGKVVSDINSLLSRLLFPMRDILVTKGLELVRRKVALSEVLDLLQGIPLTLTLLSLMMCGLMLLLTAGNKRTVFRVFGSGIGGAGILSLCVLIMERLMNLSGMIRESSVRFASQAGRLENLLSLEILAVIAALLLCAFLFLRAGNRLTAEGKEP